MADFRSLCGTARRAPFILLGLLLLAPLIAGCNRPAAAPAAPPTVQVTVAKPLVRSTTNHEDFIGRVKSAEYVEIRSRVTGYLVKTAFKDGDEVERAQELFEIDPRPFRADYNKAVADVKVVEAELKYHRADVDRNRPLAAKGVVTQAIFDKMAVQLEADEASLEARRAAASTAKLNLGFTQILSPIDGRASRAEVTYGNLVQADSTLLTTIVSVDPMFVYFDADEETFLRVQTAARDGKLKLDKGKVEVQMELANETEFPHRGLLDFAENQIDAATGTIELRGGFANPKPKVGNRELAPGLYCRVRVPLGEPHQAIMIVERAIGSDQGRKYVLVVGEDRKVQYRRVELGRLENGLRVIEAGLSADDQVIVSGLQRTKPGRVVEPSLVDMNSFVAPHAKAARPTQAASPDKNGAPSKPREQGAGDTEGAGDKQNNGGKEHRGGDEKDDNN